MISIIISATFDFIILILLVGCLLSWIPYIRWQNEPFRTIRIFCDFFFAPFRKIIPPINGFDFSPIIAFFAIGILRNIIVEILRTLHL